MPIRMSARTWNENKTENIDLFLQEPFSSLESREKFLFLSMSLGLKWSDEALPIHDASGQTATQPETWS